MSHEDSCSFWLRPTPTSPKGDGWRSLSWERVDRSGYRRRRCNIDSRGMNVDVCHFALYVLPGLSCVPPYDSLRVSMLTHSRIAVYAPRTLSRVRGNRRRTIGGLL